MPFLRCDAGGEAERAGRCETELEGGWKSTPNGGGARRTIPIVANRVNVEFTVKPGVHDARGLVFLSARTSATRQNGTYTRCIDLFVFQSTRAIAPIPSRNARFPGTLKNVNREGISSHVRG
ncbi:hypothetical protein [Methylobacterium tardum]|uniref:hypothetical protein n=1 Tax=Methylobacterium tardum TaxID=374432 RepID=UPI001EDD2B27|nr:hypothetical protein [Methylobacterium tardum]URD36566.1 hypothetical protein M6G65_30220 [Methylobacterium tardum]